MTPVIEIIATFAVIAALTALAITLYHNRGTRKQSEADLNAWKLRLEQDLQKVKRALLHLCVT